MADFARVNASRSPIVNGLLHGTVWRGGITFGLEDEAPADGGYAPQRVEVPSPEMAAAVKRAFAGLASFVAAEVAPAARGEAATVRVFVADALAVHAGGGTTRLPLGGYSFFPGDSAEAGDVWIGAGFPGMTPGGLGYRTLLHELGHALGLKHPHERGAFGPLDERLDGAERTVMSTRTLPGDALVSGLAIEPEGFSETFMPYDIAALQQLYGADFSDRGDDRYRFDPLERVMSRTIWDGGGTDTYDFARYPFAVEIDLSPGGTSRTGQEAHLNRADPSADPVYADGAIHNAMLYRGSWRSAIENARGGSGDDVIRGNRTENVLTGGSGDDALFGDRAGDRLDGGAGADSLAGGHGADSLDGGAGADRLIGQFGDDALFGGSGADVLLGLAGADTLVGGGDRDTLDGGAGDDSLAGGPGPDVFVLDAGADVVADFAVGVDRIDAGFPRAALASAVAVRGGTLVEVGGGSLFLHGVAADALTLAEFF